VDSSRKPRVPLKVEDPATLGFLAGLFAQSREERLRRIRWEDTRAADCPRPDAAVPAPYRGTKSIQLVNVARLHHRVVAPTPVCRATRQASLLSSGAADSHRVKGSECPTDDRSHARVPGRSRRGGEQLSHVFRRPTATSCAWHPPRLRGAPFRLRCRSRSRSFTRPLSGQAALSARPQPSDYRRPASARGEERLWRCRVLPLASCPDWGLREPRGLGRRSTVLVRLVEGDRETKLVLHVW